MSQTSYDSGICGSLPIHLINLIQPYGVLLIIDKKNGNIVQASENAELIFGVAVQKILNTHLEQYAGTEALAVLNGRFSKDIKDRIPQVWNINGKSFMVLVHFKEQYLAIEIDLTPLSDTHQDSFVMFYQEIKYAMANIQAAHTIKEVCAVAAQELKDLSGFDKVMIYRFDNEWNGHVIAEAREAEMESYYDFTFPASDIPQQARSLYLKNPYRLIPNRVYQPVKLYPIINPITNSFIDLSDCNLRSVAAVHLEYLSNMDVMASMSTRIIKEEALWGLIACHHREAKYLTYQMCSLFEMLSEVMSTKITSLENKEAHAFDTALKLRYTRLVEDIYRSSDLPHTLLEGDSSVLHLFNAQSAVVTYRGKTHLKGEVPDKDKLDELLLWLHTRQLKTVFHTDALSTLFDAAESYQDRGSGMLAIPVNLQRDEYIIVFRSEVVRVVKWGGNPAERLQFEKNQQNYHPRNSFKQWQETVTGTALPWRKEEVETAEQLRRLIYEYNQIN